MIKSGTMTKRQWKINALKEFSSAMEIDMNTPATIKEAIENGDWTGMRVLCTIDIREYQGRFSNDVSRMKAIEADEADDIPF